MEKQHLQITVIAKGESITHRSTFDAAHLDKLAKSPANKSALVYQLGKLVSEKPGQQSEKWQNLLEEALARYVASTSTYRLIRPLGFQTVVITIFEVNGPSGKGFQARVAGTVSEKFEDIEVTIEEKPVDDKLKNVVLFFFQGALNLYVERYTKESVFHQLKAEALSLYGKIKYASRSAKTTAPDVTENNEAVAEGKEQAKDERSDNPEDHSKSLEVEFDDFDDE